MRSFPENFNYLALWESHFGAPKVIRQDVVIPVKNLGIFDSHPLVLTKDKAIFWHSALGWVVNGLLVFHEVSLSKRKIYKARDIPPCVILDVNIPAGNKVLKPYFFEGRLNERITIDSFGWSFNEPGTVGVEWDILAYSFELQVE
jgi:hypothetical protein